MLCLGLDPDPDALPDGFGRDLAGIEAFVRLVVEAAAPFAAAVKPNLAFFEAYGSAGIAALERIRAAIPSDVLLVADAKRGDIGTTAARQAVALFDGLGADAVTVNPYLGSEAVAPLIERADRFAYLLCRTSNPGAGELQDLDVAAAPLAGVPAEPLYARVARLASGEGAGRNGRSGRRGDRPGRTRGDPHHRSWARLPRARRRDLQGGDVAPVLMSGSSHQWLRPVDVPAEACWSTSHAGSRAPRQPRKGARRTSASVWPRWRASGPETSLCYPKSAVSAVLATILTR